MLRFSRFTASLVPSVLAAAAVCAYAAPQAVELHGVVIDPSKAPVPEADIIIIREGKTVAHVQTDAQGEFLFNAPAAKYQVIIAARSFQALRSAPVPFTQGSRTEFSLQIDAVAVGYQGPTVVAEPPLPLVDSTLPAGRLPPNATSVAGTRPWEYGALVQGGVGTNDRSNYRFFSVGGHAGKVLTPNLGSGFLQGNFEYAIEVFPLWQSYTPRFQKISCTPSSGAAQGYQCSQPYPVGGTFTGVSITPIQLRWNLTHGRRWMPWLQGAGGVVWTNHKYPAIGNTNPADIASNGPSGDTSVWNFTPQFGVGTHYFVRPRRSVDFSANAIHISSASLGDKNPGVNASVQFTLGYTWWKE